MILLVILIYHVVLKEESETETSKQLIIDKFLDQLLKQCPVNSSTNWEFYEKKVLTDRALKIAAVLNLTLFLNLAGIDRYE